MKRQSFFTGAVILMTANAISKILGAVFKIPLTYILNEEGMAIYNTAFQVYIMFLAFIISGLPLAVSKTVAEAISANSDKRAYRIVRSATLILCAVGAAGSALLYFGAEFFALAMKEEKAVTAIQIISPSVFFVALGTGYKSYFQGASDMIPPAVSQVIEAFIKLAAGFALALAFIEYGIEKTAAGAISGVTVGEIAATAMLMGMYHFRKRGVRVRLRDEKGISGELMSIALPVLAASVISNSFSFIDTSVVRMRLLDAGLSPDKARFLYGSYTGYALTVFNLPVGILATLGVSILPVISGAVAAGNREKTLQTAMSGIKLVIYFSLPCAILVYAIPEQILGILFGNTTSALMLKLLSPCILFLCTAQMCAAILQASGRIILPMLLMLTGSALKLIFGWYFIGMPEYNIYGAAIAANIGFFAVMILELTAASKILGLKYKIADIIIKPGLAAAVMCMVMRMTGNAVAGFFGSGIVMTAVYSVVAAAVYFLTLLITGAVRLSEIRKPASAD